MRLFLIRHGKTPGNLRRAYVGAADEPLAAQGEEEARQLADSGLVPAVEGVYASPMLRCRQTAEILYPHQKAVLFEDLRECDFGIFEGKTYEELKEDSRYRMWISQGGWGEIPQGESAAAFRSRCERGFLGILRDAREKNLSSCAVICHGGTIQSILARYSGEEDFYRWQVKSLHGYEIQWEEDAWETTGRIQVTGPFGPGER